MAEGTNLKGQVGDADTKPSREGPKSTRRDECGGFRFNPSSAEPYSRVEEGLLLGRLNLG